MTKILFRKVISKIFSNIYIRKIISKTTSKNINDNRKSFSSVTSRKEPFDLKLNKEIFKEKENGFFIELGAYDGLNHSNTAFFEIYKNWKGILIEPSKDKFQECLRNRPQSICINETCSDIEGDFVNFEFSNGPMARIINSNSYSEYKTTTLEKILDKEKLKTNIDFLSVDVEGYELKVLNGLNLDKYRPNFILVEIWSQNKRKTIEFMLSRGYKLICNFSKYNLVTNPFWGDIDYHNDYLFKDISINK